MRKMYERLITTLAILILVGCSSVQKRNNAQALFQKAFALDLSGQSQEALGLYEKACDNGFYRACYNAGLLHEEPLKKALFFRKGCDHSVAVACYALGQLSGTIYYQKACEFGYSGGCMEMARALEKNGRLKEAFAWYRKACALDDPDGCRAVAELEQKP